MAATNIEGFLTTANADTNDYVGEWQMHVLRRNSKGFNTGSTLFGLMSRLKSENADNVLYNWWEKDPTILNFYAVSDYSDSVTTVSFQSSATGGGDATIWVFILSGGIFLNSRTLERIRVTADPTSANITVQRGVQGTTAAAIDANDNFSYITDAAVEGSVAVRGSYAQPDNFFNYIQTFKQSVMVANAYKAGVLRTDIDGPKNEATLDSLEKIANRIEWAYLQGCPEIYTSAGGPTYYTGGIQYAIDNAGLTANALNGNGPAGVTLDAFKAWLQTFMVYGDDSKLGFCGPLSYSAISNYASTAQGGFRILNQSTIFGIAITTIMTPFGQFNLAMHPLMNNNVAYQGYMSVVDLKLITQKVMEPLFYQESIELPGQDAYVGQFRAKLGLKLKFPQAFGYAQNLQLINAS
jgi:hypothetical protein